MSARATMTIPEYAEYVGIGVKLAYELAGRGELPVPVIRHGRRMVLPRAKVIRLFEGGEDEPDEP